jgi:hypothetical protein
VRPGRCDSQAGRAPATIFATQLGGTRWNGLAQQRGCECVLGPKILTKWHSVEQAGMAEAEFQDRCAWLPTRREFIAGSQQAGAYYIPEAPASFLNEFSTASRNNIGSRAPLFASSIVRLATILTAGSVRSLSPNARKVPSNAEVMAVTSSGENAPSPRKARIGIAPTPEAVAYHI